MTKNEIELFDIIRESEDPSRALMTATFIVLGYLKQLESSEERVADALQGFS